MHDIAGTSGIYQAQRVDWFPPYATVSMSKMSVSREAQSFRDVFQVLRNIVC